MEKLVDVINKKKKNNEDYYHELLQLEKEEGDKLLKIQVTYMLGVDFLLYGEKEKAFDLQCSAFSQIVSFVYSSVFKGRDSAILSSTMQKIIIEFSKMHDFEIIRVFYEKKERRLFKKMVEEFTEVRRVLGGRAHEVFVYLLGVSPEDCVRFITEEEQVDLLVECLKKDEKSFKSLLGDLRLRKENNKVLALLLVLDAEEFEENLVEVKKRKDAGICQEIYTNCLQMKSYELMTEIQGRLGGGSYEVDLEQVVFFWFITGQYKKIVSLKEKVSHKVLFISQSRLHTKVSSYTEEGIGSSWDVEEEFIKEQVKDLLRRKEESKIPCLVDSLRDIYLVLDVLHLLKEEGEYGILKRILLGIKKEDYHFEIQKILISFLHLQEMGLGVGERLGILKGVKAPFSPSHRTWLSKVLFNNLLDAYNESQPVDPSLIDSLLDYVISPESFILSLLLLRDDQKVEDLYEKFQREEIDSPQASILFYEYFLRHGPHRLNLNLSLLDDESLLYILGISYGVEKEVVLESHFRRILTQRHVEEIIMNLSLKGTISLFSFLKSLVVINLKEYLSEKARDILRMNLKIVEYIKSPEMVIFFRGILE